MDPLSICASVLAILAAGGKVSNGLRRLVSLKDAPSTLLSLENDVTTVRDAVLDIDNLLLQLPEELKSNLPSSLTNALNQARTTILEVEQSVAYDLTVITGDGQQHRIDKSRWLQGNKRIRSLVQNLRSDRVVLNGALANLTV